MIKENAVGVRTPLTQGFLLNPAAHTVKQRQLIVERVCGSFVLSILSVWF